MDTHDAAPAIELAGLTKHFRTTGGSAVHAVDGVDLTVRQGEVVALLGANGAGKTTTLDVVLGLTRPTGGSAQVLGQLPHDAVAAGRVSAVLQSGGLLRDLTVRETVEMIASLCVDPRPVDEVLERAGVTGLSSRMVSKCSGGEQQRLRFALSLLPDPDLLILDEPTAGMDVTARREFWDAMHADADAGRTVVFATHYLEEAEAFAGRIVLMAGGKVLADGSTSEIRARAAGRGLAARLPEGEARGVAEALRARPDVVRVDLRGDRVAVIARDSDAVARVLLLDHGARDLEISAASLETAFMSITEPVLEVAR
ncbi:MAG TPA: ABC transporter ATP-binding protein [Nocardioides sp.]|nr:ABC transporter ATP-binding protein [Nocardioides sp.]